MEYLVFTENENKTLREKQSQKSLKLEWFKKYSFINFCIYFHRTFNRKNKTKNFHTPTQKILMEHIKVNKEYLQEPHEEKYRIYYFNLRHL